MKKRVVSAIIMIILLVVALPLGVYTSVHPMRETAERQMASDTAGFSTIAAVDSRADAGENINKIAEKYRESDASLPELIADLESAVALARNTPQMDAAMLSEANSGLDLPANELVNKLKTVSDVSIADLNTVTGQIVEMESQQHKIDRSSYNEAAAEYNARLEQFPVSVISRFVFLEPLGLF